MPRCSAVTQSGSQCRNQVLGMRRANVVCGVHAKKRKGRGYLNSLLTNLNQKLFDSFKQPK